MPPRKRNKERKGGSPLAHTYKLGRHSSICSSRLTSNQNTRFFGSSVRCPAMGADHPLPPECHDDQQRLEDAEFCRAPWKDWVDCKRRTANGREFQSVMVRGKNEYLKTTYTEVNIHNQRTSWLSEVSCDFLGVKSDTAASTFLCTYQQDAFTHWATSSFAQTRVLDLDLRPKHPSKTWLMQKLKWR